MKDLSTKGLIGAAVAGILSAVVSNGMAETAKQTKNDSVTKEVEKCYGIIKCGGNGSCGGKGHACAGKNKCSGEGWIFVEKGKCTVVNGGSLTPVENMKH